MQESDIFMAKYHIFRYQGVDSNPPSDKLAKVNRLGLNQWWMQSKPRKESPSGISRTTGILTLQMPAQISDAHQYNNPANGFPLLSKVHSEPMKQVLVLALGRVERVMCIRDSMLSWQTAEYCLAGITSYTGMGISVTHIFSHIHVAYKGQMPENSRESFKKKYCAIDHISPSLECDLWFLEFVMQPLALTACVTLRLKACPMLPTIHVWKIPAHWAQTLISPTNAPNSGPSRSEGSRATKLGKEETHRPWSGGKHQINQAPWC